MTRTLVAGLILVASWIALGTATRPPRSRAPKALAAEVWSEW